MSNSQGTGDELRRLMEESSKVMASTDKISEKERRLLILGIRFVAGGGGVIWWKSGTPGVKPGHQVSWPKNGRTGVSTACLERVCETGQSIAPPDVNGRTWAEEPPNGHGRVVVLPLWDGDRVVGAMGLCLNRAPAPGEEAAGILRSIANLIVALRGRAVAASGASGEERRMAGEGAAITGVRTKVGKAAAYDSTILITGESGTGKELVAREIHQLSPRQRGPLVAVNCAAMPEALLESELFGHEKGAFTGAMEAKPGKFEEADGGTLFLDEIGDMPLSAQAKLLRVIEDSCVTRVGGKGSRKVSVRVIAATNRDLRAMVACGKFREDLLHRISVVKIFLPPLRDRREDIPTIVEEILRRLERKQNRKLSITPRAVELLSSPMWPGNIRELANVVEEATVLCSPDLDETHFAGIQTPSAVEAPCVPIAEAAEPPGPRLVSRAAAPTSPAGFEPGTARDLVWQRTCEVLRQTSFRICAAAKLIGWTRQWMRKFVIKHKLDELLGFIRIRRKPAAAT